MLLCQKKRCKKHVSLNSVTIIFLPPMFKKILILISLAYAIKTTYTYLENKMLNDKPYLEDILILRKRKMNDEMLQATLLEAKKLCDDNDYENAVEYYLYAYNVLGCDLEYLCGVMDVRMENMFRERI